ncbi:ribonuclease III [Georgenia halophila]|uniref:Ribonuclease 3 n=1 Tax=Georgenia halophila TaxID=620889 RepID=A0ABP8LJE4_9MICO
MSGRRRKSEAEAEPARTDVETLTGALGTPIDPELLVLSLTHRSFAHEAGGIPTNERLEFLGDAVLGVIVTEHLYRTHPGEPEGDLARMRAATVSQKALASVARELGLGDYILLGRGELVTGGREKDSILSDTVEAIIGATYLCHGLERTRAMVERLVGPLLSRAADLGAGLDWKTSLQELAAERGLGMPSYLVTGEGPDHARTFTATVVLDGDEYGLGTGSSKKLAEQNAAEDTYVRLAAAPADDGTSSAEHRA